MFQSWKEIDWLDQMLHFTVGLLVVFGLMFMISWYVALIILLIGATGREMMQHPGACGAGCRTDMLFWSLGSAFGVGLHIIIIEVIK